MISFIDELSFKPKRTCDSPAAENFEYDKSSTVREVWSRIADAKLLDVARFISPTNFQLELLQRMILR